MDSTLPSTHENIFSLEDVLELPGRGDDFLEILFLADVDHPANCVQEHIDSFRNHTRHKVTVCSPIDRRNRLRGVLREKPEISLQTASGGKFDVVVIHYSLCILFENYVPLYLREALHEFDGLKIQVIQDEYRWINRMMDEMIYLGIDGLFSSLSTDNLPKVYRHPEMARVTKVSTLPGYVSRDWPMGNVPAIKEREKHLIYRGREIPFWLGDVAWEKTSLAKEFSNRVTGKGLLVDLSSKEEDRIYGVGWLDFIKSGKAVLGLEGGSSIFDFDDSIEERVKTYLQENPDADYDEVHELILAPYEGNIVHRTITPRSFEAIAIRTAQVLFLGEYRGVMQPWRHYIPLERDFSNLDQVCGYLRDDDFLQELVDRAYEEIIESGKYDMSMLGKGMDAMIDVLRLPTEENN
jgi:hypothetical protein